MGEDIAEDARLKRIAYLEEALERIEKLAWRGVREGLSFIETIAHDALAGIWLAQAEPLDQHKHNLLIPNWTPAGLNQWQGRHWSVGHKLKKADREIVGWYAQQAGIPLATCQRRVSVKITLTPRQRACDPDAPLKSLLDALVACGLLLDDNPKWCVLGSVTFDQGAERQTEIILEDVCKPCPGD